MSWRQLRLLHPMEAKKRLAHAVTAQYHGEEAAARAAEAFARLVQRGETPDLVDEVAIAVPGGSAPLWQVLREAGLVPSNSEARRMVRQGAVEVDGERVADASLAMRDGEYLIRVGKRRFRRVRLTGAGPEGQGDRKRSLTGRCGCE